MRLQNKILLLLVPLIVLPLLALGWTAYSLLMEDARARTQHQVTTLLEQIRFHTESLMQTARANASLFASADPVMQYIQGESDSDRKAELKDEVLDLLFNYQIAYPEYYEIRILSPEGHEELRSVIGSVQNLSTDESSTAYFLGSRDKPGIIYTAFFNNPDNNKPALLTSKPLTVITDSSKHTDSHGEVRGYLMLTVDLGIMGNSPAARRSARAAIYSLRIPAAGYCSIRQHRKLVRVCRMTCSAISAGPRTGSRHSITKATASSSTTRVSSCTTGCMHSPFTMTRNFSPRVSAWADP